MYQPQPGDEGIQLLLVALRDYIASDTDTISLLPDGTEGVLPEGFMTSDTATPTILITMIGDGESAAG